MASPILEVHHSLADATVLYRTLDFFSAAAIVTNKQLMFTRADTFSDKNEGIDRLLAQIQHSRPSCGFGMGWHDDDTARAHHEKVKRSHYVSCFSQTAESVAMWSLYSPDHSSVRISTTVAKLRPPIESLLSKYSIGRLTKNDLGSRVIASVSGHIAPVEYTSLSNIVKRVTRRAKAHQRIASRYARNAKPMPTLSEVDPRYYLREQQRSFTELRNTCRLKDTSFQHEAEVRLSVRLGEEICSDIILNDQAHLDPNHKYHSLLKEDLNAWGFVSSASLPLREFAECSPDLIDTVAIDPRCPSHKAEFIRNWFMNHGISVVKSECFGYLPDSFSVYPEW